MIIARLLNALLLNILSLVHNDLIQEVLKKNMGCDEPSLLASDFLFIFPIVGPLKKEEFIEVMFILEQGFRVRKMTNNLIFYIILVLNIYFTSF